MTLKFNSMGTKIMTHLHWANESSTSVRLARAAHQTRSFELSRTITWLLAASPWWEYWKPENKSSGDDAWDWRVDKLWKSGASRWSNPLSSCNWPLTEKKVLVVNSGKKKERARKKGEEKILKKSIFLRKSQKLPKTSWSFRERWCTLLSFRFSESRSKHV